MVFTPYINTFPDVTIRFGGLFSETYLLTTDNSAKTVFAV